MLGLQGAILDIPTACQPGFRVSDEPAQIEPLLWNAGQTAAALSVSPETVKNLHRVGELRGVKCGKHLRWAPQDVIEYVGRLRESNGRQ